MTGLHRCGLPALQVDPRLRPVPHPLAPSRIARFEAAGPRSHLPPAPDVTHDLQGNPLPDLDDISGLYADLIEWGPCHYDPWDMWGWSSVIYLVRHFAPDDLRIDRTDWRLLFRTTDAHTATSALIYLTWFLKAPPAPSHVRPLLRHIAHALSTPCQASSPHVRAINALRGTIDRRIAESLPADGPVFVSPLKLPSLRDIDSVWPRRTVRKYGNSEHPDWPRIIGAGKRIARDDLQLPPEAWMEANSAIGPQLAAIAALAVFAERGPKPETPRFLELVRQESSRPGFLRDGLRPRRKSILPRGPLLGQPRTQS